MATTRGQWKPAKHLKYINRIVTEVALSDEPRFVIIETPPRHGKSQLMSRFTPAWYIGLNPDKYVMLLGYDHDFGAMWGREARNLMEEWGEALYGIRVSRDSSAAHRWRVQGHEGGMYATGIGGQIIGKGGNLIVIDDPVKGWLEAQSETYRQHQWDWYLGTLRHRLEPGGSIIMIITRWHEDDIAGRLLAGVESEYADHWELVRLPAIAEPELDDRGRVLGADDPDTWRDAIGRGLGDALWPWRYDVSSLRQIEASVGPIVWESVFQQRPTAREGGLFKTHDWRYMEGYPWQAKLIRRFDLAATEKQQGNDPDWSAAVLMGRDDRGRTVILDARRIRAGPKEVKDWVKATVRWDEEMAGRRVPVRLEQEPGSSGKSVVDDMISTTLAGWDVVAQTSTGDKYARATPYASQQAAQNVYLVEGEWNHDFTEEHRQFPTGAHDDWVDAASLAYLDLHGGIAAVAQSYKRPAPRSRR